MPASSATLGIEMPVNQKRRFQDGAVGDAARARVEGVVPSDVQQTLAGSAARRRLTRSAIRERGGARRWNTVIASSLNTAGRRHRLDPQRAYASAWEEEPDESGALVPTAVVFLTNRECPFRCVMCDLWKNTLDEAVPPRRHPAPDSNARLPRCQPARHIKLYNAGSFFDPQQIPLEDDEDIARDGRGLRPRDRRIASGVSLRRVRGAVPQVQGS